MADRVIEELSEDQCLNLIAGGGIGRIAYRSRFGPAVLPVNYALLDGAVVFRTAQNGPVDEDLRTGITGADYKVAFEIDSIDLATRQGWSVLIQGPAHHVTGAGEDAVRGPASSPGPQGTGSCSSRSSRPVSRGAASGRLKSSRARLRSNFPAAGGTQTARQSASQAAIRRLLSLQRASAPARVSTVADASTPSASPETVWPATWESRSGAVVRSPVRSVHS